MTPARPKPVEPEKSKDVLIQRNGELVEELFDSNPWIEIAFPLLAESIAGVSGRFTNGRYWHGSLTTNWKDQNSLFVAGYQKALMDFNNNLHDFIVAKNKLIEANRLAKKDKDAPVYDPFMEDEDG